MKKKSLVLSIILLGLIAILYTPITANAASDDTGTWGTIEWEFEASSGTLTFKNEGEIPSAWNPNTQTTFRPWANIASTDGGVAIKKIVFEKPCVLPADSYYLFGNLENLEELVGFDMLDASNVEDVSSMFYYTSISNVDGLTNWNMENVTKMQSIFGACSSLKDISGLTNWNTKNVTNMTESFSSCRSLEDISALANWNTDNLIYMGDLFSSCNIKDVSNLANWNVSNVIEMFGVFGSNQELEDISPLANWDTGNVTHLSFMFCYTGIKNLGPLANWDVSSLKYANDIFASCNALVNADALGNWNADKLIEIPSMFDGNSNLESVDLSSWNTKNVPADRYSMERIFYSNSKLESITLGENSVFNSIVKLPAIDTSDGNYTGEWIGVNTGNIYSSSDDFMTNYDGSIPDTYIWRVTPNEDPEDLSSLNVQDSTLYVGDEWNPEDNFVNATDKDGNKLEFSSDPNLPENSEWSIEWNGEVDTSTPGEYEVEYKVVEYYLGEARIEHKTATATITVLEREAKVVPATIQYLDENEEPIHAPKDRSSVIGSYFSFESPIEIEGYTVDLASTTFVVTHDDGSTSNMSYDDVLSQTNTSTWNKALDFLNSRVIASPTKSVTLTYRYREVLPNPTFSVGYVFESGSAGKALPKAVTDLLPSDTTSYADGEIVTALAPAQTTITTSTGTWTFQGWDADNKTVSGDDVIFTGTWTFEANQQEAPSYNVGYVFESGTDGKALPKAITDLLPTDTTVYPNGEIVTAVAPTQKTVTTSTGTWTFQGWDADSKTVSVDDVIFTGTWTFEANEPDTPDNPNAPGNTDNPDNPDTSENLSMDKNLKQQSNNNLPETGDTEKEYVSQFGIMIIIGIMILTAKNYLKK